MANLGLYLSPLLADAEAGEAALGAVLGAFEDGVAGAAGGFEDDDAAGVDARPVAEAEEAGVERGVGHHVQERAARAGDGAEQAGPVGVVVVDDGGGAAVVEPGGAHFARP